MSGETKFEGRDILSIKDLSRSDIEFIFSVARKMESFLARKVKKYPLRGNILASLFFQPSTRTRLSFEAAMHRLGGGVIGFASPEVSRAGDVFAETLSDTAYMVEKYADVIVIRHPLSDAPSIVAKHASIPVISAGAGTSAKDSEGGGGEHPTQALLDMYTIKKERTEIDGLNLLLVGNVNSRAVSSLGYGLAKFNNVNFYFLSPFSLPKPLESDFDVLGLRYERVSKIEDIISEIDVLYVNSTRLALQADKTEDAYRLDLRKLESLRVKKDLIILHPLARLDELATDIDSTPFAKYLSVQPFSGLVIRMALLSLVLGKTL